NARSLGVALRFSGRIIAYAVGSPLENHDEEGVHDDPHYGDQQTFYLLAMAVHPAVANADEVEQCLLETLHRRVSEHGFLRTSALMEDRWQKTGPAWLRLAEVLKVVENYLGSGQRFVYVQAPIPASPTSRDGPEI